MSSGRGRLRRLAAGWRAAAGAEPAELRVEADALPSAVSRRLKRAVADELERVRAPGAQVVVRRRGALVWSATAGRLDGEAPVAADDRFVIASVTKPVVATLLALLADRGALDLDDPVGRWLPALPYARTLTVRQLLSQRSGLPDYPRDREVRRRLNGGEPDYPWTRGEVIEAIARLGGARKPGGRFAYRNANFIVAAEIAERVGGRDIEALLRDLVAGPLGLTGLSFERSVAGTRPAGPHVVVLGRAVDLLPLADGRIPNDAMGPVWGDGGIASSAGDLARFTEALLLGELVTPGRLREMVTPGPRQRFPNYGLGLILRREGDAVEAGHEGMYFGWTASSNTDDATGTTVSAVANVAATRPPAGRLARAARRALAEPA